MKFLKFFAASLAVSLASPITNAAVIVFDDTDWVGGVNHGRTFLGGGGDNGWTIFDAASTGASSQQYLWMDVSSAIGQIGPGETVVSATLTFSGARDLQGGNTGATVDFSIFEVLGDGTDRGRASIIDGTRETSDVTDFYAANTGYGAVTGITSSFEEQTFDITTLVSGWADGTLTTNIGQMNLLWDERTGSRNYIRWGNTDNDASVPTSLAPVLTITTVVPEPGTYALLAGLTGFAFVALRRRK